VMYFPQVSLCWRGFGVEMISPWSAESQGVQVTLYILCGL